MEIASIHALFPYTRFQKIDILSGRDGWNVIRFSMRFRLSAFLLITNLINASTSVRRDCYPVEIYCKLQTRCNNFHRIRQFRLINTKTMNARNYGGNGLWWFMRLTFFEKNLQIVALLRSRLDGKFHWWIIIVHSASFEFFPTHHTTAFFILIPYL